MIKIKSKCVSFAAFVISAFWVNIYRLPEQIRTFSQMFIEHNFIKSGRYRVVCPLAEILEDQLCQHWLLNAEELLRRSNW